MGRSRGGLTSKIHAVVDANGLPVRIGLTPGEAHDNQLWSELLNGLRPRTVLLADRGFDADWIRALASQQGAWANIPPKRNRKDPICFSPYLYRAAAETMTPLEREASTPKGELKSPYADFASVAEESHRKYMAAGCMAAMAEEAGAAWPPVMTTTPCSG